MDINKTKMTTPERLAALEEKVTNIDSKVDGLDAKLDKLIDSLDSRYASKTVERIVYGICVLIASALVTIIVHNYTATTSIGKTTTTCPVTCTTTTK